MRSRYFTKALVTAGADLGELSKISTAEAYRIGWLKDLEDAFGSFRKPIIAAIRGFAVCHIMFNYNGFRLEVADIHGPS